MYSSLKNVQILLSLLKNNGIKHVVISPGGCNIPLVRSIENDPFFVCFSVVDERSAAYFAIGISQSVHAPVVALCTSGTAVCNYSSGVTEAFYQGVPLVVVTADRHPYLYKQMETQKINQVDIFKDVTKKSVTLPVVLDDNDFWYCQRLVNEALLELNHHGTGPVHINIPTGVLGIPSDFLTKELPAVVTIKRIMTNDSKEVWAERVTELSSYKRIMVVVGQGRPYTEAEITNFESFCKIYNCVLSVEHLSNLNCEGALITYPVTEMLSAEALESLLPDLIISIGHNIAGANIKGHFRSNKARIKHWLIDETGNVKDVFKSLTTIFECSVPHFFEYFAKNATKESCNDGDYRRRWMNALDAIKVPDLPFSNMYVAQELAKKIPSSSLLHLGILNSTRHMQFFNLNKSIEVFSNIGALGIDGSMSTFIGQAAVLDKLCFLLIGDLSFFYDMNSAGIRHVGGNVRIVMVNNGGGGEFHLLLRATPYSRINDHIATKHTATAKGWIESLGFRYYSATTKEELEVALAGLVSASDVPIFLEVFTEIETDANITYQIYSENTHEGVKSKSKGLVKTIAKTVLGDSAADKAISVIKRMIK